MKRELDIVVLSDLHLGTYGCHARELLNYLKSIQPRTLVLNGDIIDMWYFKKSYFPKEHFEVIRRLMKMAVSGTKVYYLTGNHDDVLRKFGEMAFGMIHLRNKLVFQVDGKTHWVFHGDVFDASIHRARWLAKLGGEGYDLLIRINRGINRMRRLFGLGPVSFAARVKKGVKGAVRYISDFEDTAIQLAAEKGYDYVLAALATAAAVTTTGSVGFVGLIVPHLVRLAIGNDQRVLLPAAALAGGALLTLADTLARTVVAPQQLPVGVLTALIGVPVFLYLLTRSPRSV